MDTRLKLNAQIEDALTSQPLAAMPRSITTIVMADIQKDARPVFLTWNDFALSLVSALSLAALWYAGQNLPPILVARIRIQGILLYQDYLVNARWLIPAAMIGLAALLTAITIPSLLQWTRTRKVGYGR